MELQWDKKQITCLKQKIKEVQNQEQTLEIRLPEEMPDIARIICGWGQVILRGKEWRGDGMGISGGVMAWVLYAPEDGSAPRTVEGWLPFQMKWNFPKSSRDGAIRVDMHLRSVDARVLSARKMMVRAAVSVLGEALEPDTLDIYQPGNSPGNVELLKRTYPALLQVEAGEKTFQVEEDLQVSGVRPTATISNTLIPILTEEKVVGGKAVFRGECRIHLVYIGEDGNIYSTDLDMPFAQYSDLDQDYGKDAAVDTTMTVSNLETDWVEGNLRVKCTLSAQYVIRDEMLLNVVEDAYGIGQNVIPEIQDLVLPVILDSRNEEKKVAASVSYDWTDIVDAAPYMEQPVTRRANLSVDVELPGTVQLLCRDASGQYQGVTARFQGQWSIASGENANMTVTVVPTSLPMVATNGENMEVSLPVTMQTVTTAEQKIPMVTGLKIGDTKQPDTQRPSLILRRCGQQSLWDLAKGYGTSVDAIRNANHLEAEPECDRMLLIPIQ